MGYRIKYDDIRALQNTTNSQFSNWQQQLINIRSSINDVNGMSSFNGKGANAIKAYLKEVHLPLIYAIMETMSKFRSNLQMYSNG